MSNRVSYLKTYLYLAFLSDKVLNEVSNRNFDDFAAELIPMVQDSLSLSVLNISNAIVENFTFKQLFPY